MEMEWLGVLGLAFGLGLVHALDADHVAAVSGLASARPARGRAWRYGARWAVGHGVTLLALGTAAWLLGVAIPETLSVWAERLIGVFLVLIGVWLLWDISRRRLHVHFHTHDGLPSHAHWHAHSDAGESHRHAHGALWVGVLHGAAGSAPLLALVPLAQASAPWMALAYLTVFGAGILAAMLIAGGVLEHVFDRLARRGETALAAWRYLVAFGSLGIGAWWLAG